MQEQSIFIEALERTDPAQRAAYLDEACAGDTALRQRIERLLQRHQQGGHFLDSPADDEVMTIVESGREAPGTLIGPYQLLEKLGEGGFGIVFLAEQKHPVRRRVALKVLKPGMDSKQVVARFEAERQALALMDHPHIAKVLDGGTTASGRPFFVMEFVLGLPITEYCDQNQLTPKERLELFISVCQAVQHAHHKGIIHRDLKPSNVLVTLQDDRPVVKVIDFGIAKAIDQRLTDKTLYTQAAALVGTPLYMSPEQAGMRGLDIDVRSDIYSLGVLLYELLTGTTPFDVERLRQASYDEIRRIIREEEPPRPSTRVLTLGPTGTILSARRRSDPRRLRQRLRGELDWIVMKALEKDRTRRYETASAFAADVQRYLKDEPVQAGPPSRWYRLGKVLRKHRAATLTAAAFLGLLVTGAAVSVRQAVRATRAETEAQRSAAKAQAINKFLIEDMLNAATPEENRGRKVLVEEVLDRAAKKVATAFPDQPEVEAGVRLAIGSAYVSLGIYEKAEPHVVRALDLRRSVLGPEHPETLEALARFASLRADQGRYPEAEALYRQALTAMRSVLGDDHPTTLNALDEIAMTIGSEGRLEEAGTLFRQCLEGRRRVQGEDHPDTIGTAGHLAHNLVWRGHWQEADELFRRALADANRVLAPDHPVTLYLRSRFTELLKIEGKWREAEAFVRQTVREALQVWGPEHISTFYSRHDLGLMLLMNDRNEEAEQVLRECVAAWSRVMPGNPEMLNTRTILAMVELTRGKVEDAGAHFEELYQANVRIRGPDHVFTLFSLQGRGLVYREQGRWAEAEAALTAAQRGLVRVFGAENELTLRTASFLAFLRDDRGKGDEAEKLFVEVIAARRRTLPSDHPLLGWTLYGLGEHCLATGDLRRAGEALEEALTIQRQQLPPQHRAIGQTLCALGWQRVRLGQVAEGEGLLREGWAICRQAFPPGHWAPADAESRLGAGLVMQKRFPEAEALLLDGHKALEKYPGTPSARLAESRNRIIQLYEAWGKPADAAAWRTKTQTGGR